MSTFVPTRWMIRGGALLALVLLLAACGDITVAPDPFVCEPVCEDRTCGDDGCGGVCGTCEDGQACAEGQCANLICTPEMGGCDGELNLVTCNATGTAFDADVPAEDCSASFEGQGRCEQTDADEDGVPEDAACVCGPVCDGISCGDDGCGGSCGTCAETETCQDGGCVALICTPGQPYCDEAQLFTCNGDGTGFDATGTATDCSQEHGGQGICVAEDWDENGVPETAACQCAPACDGFNCGDDGCGSVCGECAETDACDGGTCTPVICTPGESYCVDGTLSTCNDLGTGPATDGATEDCAPLFAGQGACQDEDAGEDGVVDTAACVCVPACDDKGCWEDSGCQLDDGSAIHCDEILCDAQPDHECFEMEDFGLTLEDNGNGCLLPIVFCAEETIECGSVTNKDDEPFDCATLVNKSCSEGFICEEDEDLNDCLEVVCEANQPYCQDATTVATCNDLGTGSAAGEPTTGCAALGKVCDNGACADVICDPGQPWCNGEVAATCNALGTGADDALPIADCAAEATAADQPIICVIPEDGPAACECQIQCDGKVCGDDACGGTCAPGCADEAGTTCDAGQCELVHCTAGQPFCTDDGQLWTCNALGTGADPEVDATDCLPLHGGQGGCEATDAEDDGITDTAACVCVPACDGKSCGDDGCGSVCGTCEGDEVCDGDLQCVAQVCAPESTYCDGDIVRTCDAWGAGPNPGVAFQQCDLQGAQIHCIQETLAEGGTSATCQCVPACDGAYCSTDDGCGSPCADHICEDGENCFTDLADTAEAGDGCHSPAAACGLGAIACGSLGLLSSADTVDCADHAKTCDEGWVCNETYQCDCVPACDGKECGQDHCGNSCGDNDGTCAGAQDICNDDGLCECVPACDGKECGPDGCGGECPGVCADGTFCDEVDGLCVDQLCEPGLAYCDAATVIATCNDDGSGPNLAFGLTNCATEFAGQGGCDDGLCICVSDCSGKLCGDSDGCGGLCGCDAGEYCNIAEGACISCAHNAFTCSDDLLLACEDWYWSAAQDDWIEFPVAKSAVHCGSVASGDAPEECLSHPQFGATCSCTPQCDGKTCGPDGCGGTCGPACGPGEYCSTQGSCEATPCGDCDDGDPCTMDVCEADGTCSSSPAGVSLDARGVHPGSDIQATHVLGGMAYIAAGPDGLQMVDVTDLSNPQPVATMGLSGILTDVHVDGASSYAYLLDETYGLTVADVWNVTQPEEVSGFDWYASWGLAQRLEVTGDELWVADLEAAILLDINEPLLPARPATGGEFYPFNGSVVWDVSLASIDGEDVLFSAHGTEGLVASLVDELDFNSGAYETVYAHPAGSDVRSVAVVTNTDDGTAIAYAADRMRGLAIVDVSNAASETFAELGTWSFPNNSPGRASDVFVHTGKGPLGDRVWVYLAAGPGGLMIIDATDPGSPFLTATYPLHGNAQRVEATDEGGIFISAGAAGLHIVEEISCCVPDCEGKTLCAADGCGGYCGNCADAEAGYCSGDPDASSPLGGACCRTPEDHPTNPGCYYSQPGYDSNCKNSQCEDGSCYNSSYCSKDCEVTTDVVVNHTGEAGLDFVLDADADNPCAGFADGPVGASFQCVQTYIGSIEGRCEPGTTFAYCDSSAQCPEGESCRPMYIGSEYSSRCVADFKDGVDLGERCNTNPDEGLLIPCNGGPFCTSGGYCLDLCDGNEACATDTCVDGFCSKSSGKACGSNADCSAMMCWADYQPYSWAPAFTDDTCQPRYCSIAGDCNDPDWYCQPYYSTTAVPGDISLVGVCQMVPEGEVGYGEACGVPGDGTGLPPCVSDAFCIDNRCSGPCSQDAHCAADEACLVGDEWPVDSDGDLAYDDYVNIDLCVPWPNESPNTLCLTDSDCAEGHHCEFRIKGTGEGTDRVWEVEYACKKDDPDQLRFPAECTAENKNDCVGNCLFGGGAVTGLCTEPCASAADCPAFSWEGQNYEGVCYSYGDNKNTSMEPEDDLYVPYCWYASPLASLASCEDTRQCDAPGIDGGGEYCRAHAIARNPSEPVLVEHLCRDSSWNLAEEPLKEVGEACNTYTQCRSRSCLAGGPNGGYCGSLCLVDSDCKSDDGIDGLQCLSSVVLERSDPALSGTTKTCLLP